MRRLLALLAASCTLTALAQQPAPPTPPAPPSPPKTAVNPDGTITFRYSNAGATAVEIPTDAAPKPLPMQKGPDGVWTATTAPLKPEHYGYSFKVDGVEGRDPLNPNIRPNIVGLYSDILVPGSVPQPWEVQAIPHGSVTRFSLTTHTAQGLPAGQEPYIVYTPPGYDPKRPGGYPLLALLHGWSDTEVGWTAVGQANLILDTLLAQGKIEPMLVVMPMGYGDYSFVTGGGGVWQDPGKVERNVSIYSDMLLGEILPAVTRDFAVDTDPNKHAIAGLSMGGLEAVTIGLKHPEIFRYVIGMSSALHDTTPASTAPPSNTAPSASAPGTPTGSTPAGSSNNTPGTSGSQLNGFDQQFPNFAGGNGNTFAQYKLLWIACGTDDHLITPNRHFVAWAKQRNLPVTAVETPGQHTWLVWRDNLLTVAPLLFR